MLFNIVNCCNIFMYNIITFLIFSQNKNKLSKLSVKQNSAIKCPLIHFLLVSYFQSLDASQLLKIIKNQFFSKNVEFINYRKSSFCRTYLQASCQIYDKSVVVPRIANIISTSIAKYRNVISSAQQFRGNAVE